MPVRAPLNTLLVILAAAPLVGTAVDVVLARGNHSLRVEVDRRQLLIAESAQLARVNEALMPWIPACAGMTSRVVQSAPIAV